MIEILPAPDHVAAFRLTGTVTEDDFERVVGDIEARLKRHQAIGVLVDLTDFEDMTVMAGFRDACYGFGKILEWKRFPREAVVTDRGWVEMLVALANPVVPFVEIKSFKPAEFAAALAWVTEIEGGPNA